jgi:hypothetical protein
MSKGYGREPSTFELTMIGLAHDLKTTVPMGNPTKFFKENFVNIF